MADVVQFPDCCGIIILNKFQGGHPGADPENCISEKACNEFLQKQEQQYFQHRAGLMAVLSEPQEGKIGHVFRERKWDLLKEVINPRTNVRIFIYFRDMNYTKAREKRIFGAGGDR